MATDITAQAFREAAAQCTFEVRWKALLLAAAEQREQVDELMSERVAFRAKAEQILEEHETELCPEDMGCKDYITWLQKQIATLTAERDEARATITQVREIADKQIGVFDSDEVRAEILALIDARHPPCQEIDALTET